MRYVRTLYFLYSIQVLHINCKLSALALFRLHFDVTSKSLSKVLADGKTQPCPSLVHLSILLNLCENVKELRQLLPFDSNSCISHPYLQVRSLLLLWIGYLCRCNHYIALLCVLYSVR